MQFEKTLIGIFHARKEEINEVYDFLNGNTPRVVALELREDYVEKRKEGWRTPFFNDFEEYFSERGSRIIPLLKPNHKHNQDALSLARQAILKKGLREELEFEEKELESIAKDIYEFPPNRLDAYKKLTQLRTGLNILRKYTPQQIEIMWNGQNRRINDYANQLITKESPDLVIMGNAHIRVIAPSQPSYKTYYTK